MKDEYGSAEEAAREFCADAGSDESTAVAEEWSRLLGKMKGQPLTAINRILTGPLGSAYTLTDKEVEGLTAIFARAIRRR